MSLLTPTVESASLACYAFKKPCNHFVREVAARIGVSLSSMGIADSLIDAASAQWITLNVQQAAEAADRGEFVLAGIKSKEFSKPESQGHVAILLPGRIAQYPRVASTNEGSTHWGKSRGDVPLTHVFPASDVHAGKIRYFTPRSRWTTGGW